MHKRIVGRIPKLNGAQHRNLSLDSNNGSHNIPEQVSLEQESMESEGRYESLAKYTTLNNSISQLDEKTSPKIKSPDKKMSKSSILRNLFFQNENGPSKS